MKEGNNCHEWATSHCANFSHAGDTGAGNITDTQNGCEKCGMVVDICVCFPPKGSV